MQLTKIYRRLNPKLIIYLYLYKQNTIFTQVGTINTFVKKQEAVQVRMAKKK